VSFPQNLQLWDVAPDIPALQQFLNIHGFILAIDGPGSPGQETDFFGMKTYKALINFQSANGLPTTVLWTANARRVCQRVNDHPLNQSPSPAQPSQGTPSNLQIS
jgi:hypothetical protein